jgi:hypothetical protein
VDNPEREMSGLPVWRLCEGLETSPFKKFWISFVSLLSVLKKQKYAYGITIMSAHVHHISTFEKVDQFS